jgi:transposase
MPAPDTENLVVTLHGRGWSQRKLAEELGISRNTVRSILRRVQSAREQGHSALPTPPSHRASMLDAHDEFIRQRLSDYPTLSAIRIHEDLCERGFEGGYTIVKERVRELRPKPKKAPSRPMDNPPGKYGQQDWSPYTLRFTVAGVQEVNCFSLALAFSRRQYIDFTERQDFYTFIRQHVRAFKRFGGVPHEVVYDRQKVVVLGRECGRNIYNPRFVAFATHYRFRPRALPPRSPKLKPIVEKAFQYVEGHCLAGREFRDLDHLRSHALWWMDHKSDPHKHRITGEPPIERFAQERDLLRPLPARPYDTAEVGYRVVDVYGFVLWDTTPYSVPYGYVLDIVVVRVTADEVFIYSEELTVIARHERRPHGHTERVELPGHHPKKTRRDIDALVVRMATLGEVGELFAAGVNRRQRLRGEHLARVLALQERYALDDLHAALNRAVRYQAFDASTVVRILEATATPRVLPDSADYARQRLAGVTPRGARRDMGVYAEALRGRTCNEEE